MYLKSCCKFPIWKIFVSFLHRTNCTLSPVRWRLLVLSVANMMFSCLYIIQMDVSSKLFVNKTIKTCTRYGHKHECNMYLLKDKDYKI